MEIYKVLAEDVARKLSAIKAQFKIIMPDGTELGDLEVVKPKTRKAREYTVPYGTYQKIYAPYLITMQVADVIEIDPKEHGLNDWRGLANAAQAAMIHKWGNGSAKYHYNEKSKKIEFMRLM